MRTKLIRTTALAATAVAAILSLSACGAGGTDSAADSSSPGAALAADSGPAVGGGKGGSAQPSDSTATSAGPESAGATGGGGSGSGGSAPGKTVSGKGGGGSAGKSGHGQTCGTGDLTWSARTESQAGGYILVSVKARPGITCVLPAELPGVAFGSDGTEAGPAEQSVGEPVTLSGTTTAYAGVNPKTTNSDGGKELDEIITTVSTSDVTDPVSLKTGSITVDDPIVTNWHTAPGDAVPGDGLDN